MYRIYCYKQHCKRSKFVITSTQTKRKLSLQASSHYRSKFDKTTTSLGQLVDPKSAQFLRKKKRCTNWTLFNTMTFNGCFHRSYRSKRESNRQHLGNSPNLDYSRRINRKLEHGNPNNQMNDLNFTLFYL